MSSTIIFIDTEIDPKTKKILDIGSIKDNGSTFHKVNFIVYWLKEGADKEVLIVLPEVWFERSVN